LKIAKPTLAAILLTVLCVTTTFAAILVIRQYEASGKIVAVADLVLLKPDGSPVTTIAWGDFVGPGVITKTTTQIFGGVLRVKNIGNSPLWVAWTVENLPNFCALTAFWDVGGSNDAWPKNYPTRANAQLVAGALVEVSWTLAVDTSTPQTFSFTLKLMGSDSQSG